jgi:acetyltransferase-like isoleucine patch superfamily enzyme
MVATGIHSDYTHAREAHDMPTIDTIAPYADKNGNRIIGTPKSATACKVLFRAKNCTLELGEGVSLQNCTIHFDCDGGRCTIGAESRYKGSIRIGLGSKVEIGTKLTVTGACYITTAERATVVIGDDCMFASHNEIRADDAHPIFDLHTGARINRSRSIRVGNHVWLATEVVLLGGSSIGDGSVIGYRSLVKSAIPENSIAAGLPARVVRRDIVWERNHLTLTAPYDFPGTSIAPANLEQRKRPSVRKLVRKLSRNPQAFLADSRSPLLRTLGSWMRKG